MVDIRIPDLQELKSKCVLVYPIYPGIVCDVLPLPLFCTWFLMEDFKILVKKTTTTTTVS